MRLAQFRARPQVVDAMWDGKKWHVIDETGQRWTCSDRLFQMWCMPDDHFAETLVGERVERVYASHLPSGAQITIVADRLLKEQDWSMLVKVFPMIKNGFVDVDDTAGQTELKANKGG